MIRLIGEAVWNILKIYGVGQQILEGIKAFYWEASVFMKVEGELGDRFAIRVGKRRI